MKQQSFQRTNWDHRFCYGGELRKSRFGRGIRPLSTKDPLHVVFKIRAGSLKKGLRNPVTYTLVNKLLMKYSKKFFVKIEQFSVNADHIHLLIRCYKRSLYHHFFRVLAGQIAQQLIQTAQQLVQSAQHLIQPAQQLTDTQNKKKKGTGIWMTRPWSRVIKGYTAYKTVRNYVLLNKKEAEGTISYRKERTRGLSDELLRELWS